MTPVPDAPLRRRAVVIGLKTVGWVLSAVCVWWVLRELWTQYFKLGQSVDFHRLAGPLVGGVGLWVGVNLCLGLIWQQGVALLGEKVSLRAALGLSLRVQVAKYLPGNVFHYAGRVALARRIGLTTGTAAGAALFEPVVLLLVAGIATLRIWGRLPVSFWVLPVAAGAIALMIWSTRKLWRERVIALRDRLQVRPRELALAGLAALGVFILQTAMFVWIERALAAETTRSVVATFEMVTASWAAGFVVVGSPGGLGVREFVLTLFAPATELGPVVLVAALTRLCAMAGDVVSLGIGLLLPLSADR